MNIIKQRLTEQSSKFYLVASKNPSATYKVLWYRLSGGHSCKVDVLRPGLMNIPDIEPGNINRIDNIPVMPLSFVLLSKLQAWSERHVANQMYLRKKQCHDDADIIQLLPIAKSQKISPSDDRFITESFLSVSRERIHSFVKTFPSTEKGWRALGLSTPVRHIRKHAEPKTKTKGSGGRSLTHRV